MPEAAELAAQFVVIVNLAVEDDRHALVFVEDGLLATGNVDDAEASHAHRDAVAHVVTVVVGSAVANRIAHARHPIQSGLTRIVKPCETGYAAHRVALPT